MILIARRPSSPKPDTFLSCARPFACLDGATCLRRSTTRSKMRQDQHTRKTLAPARARPRWPRNPTSCSAPRAGRRAFRGSIALRSQLQARATQSILGGSGDTTKKRVTHIGVSSRYAGSEASAGTTASPAADCQRDVHAHASPRWQSAGDMHTCPMHIRWQSAGTRRPLPADAVAGPPCATAATLYRLYRCLKTLMDGPRWP